MSDGQGTHPTVKELRRYSLFGCDGEQWEPVAAQLTECDECGMTLLLLATESRRGGRSERAGRVRRAAPGFDNPRPHD